MDNDDMPRDTRDTPPEGLQPTGSRYHYTADRTGRARALDPPPAEDVPSDPPPEPPAAPTPPPVDATLHALALRAPAVWLLSQLFRSAVAITCAVLLFKMVASGHIPGLVGATSIVALALGSGLDIAKLSRKSGVGLVSAVVLCVAAAPVSGAVSTVVLAGLGAYARSKA